jgi:hypothetical protein
MTDNSYGRLLMAAHWRHDHSLTWAEIARRTGWHMRKPKDNEHWSNRAKIERIIEEWEDGGRRSFMTPNSEVTASRKSRWVIDWEDASWTTNQIWNTTKSAGPKSSSS